MAKGITGRTGSEELVTAYNPRLKRRTAKPTDAYFNE
jgi:hypothetical protein